MSERITFVVSLEHKKLFLAAAEKDGLDLSNWIRFNLITAARPRGSVGRPAKERVYKWCGEEVPREVYVERMAAVKSRDESREAELAALRISAPVQYCLNCKKESIDELCSKKCIKEFSAKKEEAY